MNGYAEHFTRHLRLSILLVLTEAPEYSTNDSVISTAVSTMGLSATRDRIRTELVWLEEQSLIVCSAPAPGMTVARLTERGADVAAGRASSPGVQRPSPKG
jgi:Asp/Glu/hydantoin racemase